MIVGRAVWQIAVEEQTAAGRERHGYAVGHTVLHLAVTHLPIADLKVREWPAPVPTRHHTHATVLCVCRIERDPHADDARGGWQVEVSVVLVPGLLAPAWWF